MRRTFAQLIRGKTIDLKSAYRQLPLSEGALNKAFIAVKDSATNEVNFFRLLCLPFGAVASVHAFIRVNLEIAHISHVLFLMPMTAFYDDFTVLSIEDLVDSTEKAAHFVSDVL